MVVLDDQTRDSRDHSGTRSTGYDLRLRNVVVSFLMDHRYADVKGHPTELDQDDATSPEWYGLYAYEGPFTSLRGQSFI